MNRRGLLALGLPLAMSAVAGADAALAQPAALPPAKHPLFPDDDQFWFETVRAFGNAEYGGAQFGEVLSTSAAIESGDYDSWYDAWNATADRTAKEAEV